jgi:hypothetical protein
MIEQATTEQKLDQIISQQHKTMSLLEKMLEEQRRIALCLEQLEKKWHVLLLLRCRLEVATLPSQSQW